MTSSRLPGKVLLPLGNATVLDQVVNRAREFSSQVVVCTSDDQSDDPIAHLCKANNTVCVRGSLTDVFSRFRSTLADPRVSRATWFARITADCPLLSPSLARLVIARAHSGLDYIAPTPEQLPLGISLELVRTATFEAIDPNNLDAPQREHVTPVFYENPNRFRCRWIDAPSQFAYPKLRLTLDYPEDYELLKQLFRDPRVTTRSAIARLLKSPNLAVQNRHCVQRNARSPTR